MTTTSDSAPRNNSASLRRALSILQLLGDDLNGDGRTITQIATELDLNKSTVTRLLQPMLETSFLEQAPGSGSYRLSWETARLGQAYLSGVRPDRDMHEALATLSESTMETAHLVRSATPSVVYIDKVDSPHAVRMISRVGNTQPMYSTSVGKCILAFADDETIQTVIDAGMPARTATTITTAAGLRAELATIREQGWAIDDVENEDGIRCVAAPIFDASGGCSHAVSVSGPVSRVPRERVPELVPLVIAAATDISRRMGALPQDRRLPS
ncbi:IclR family transcriptional regulator [Leucobacter komagatae]|uniref:IclR family transcriptional regulator n=1 Tax=Leucobacter komagatae TaxID=55969 RepID=A0A0D0H4X4_9MICO|nr:IclR family transcriptional regulator [Leucobacter komagatae]KIP52200.1 IclR family transcriptional regulator [Leucobacter komagatae]